MAPEDRACALHERALQRLDAGDPRGAKRLFSRALAIFDKLGADARGDSANVLVELAAAERQTADPEGARASLERALDLLRGARGGDIDRLRARAGSDLACTLIDLGELRGALGVARRAARIAEGLPAEDRAPVFNTLGMACKYNGRFAEGLRAYARARAAARRAHPGESIFLATLEHNVGGILHAKGDFKRAEPHARRSVAIRRAHLGPDHPDALADEAALAAVLDGLAKWDEAEAIHRRVIEGFARALGPRHAEVAHATGNFAAHLQLRGRAAEAAKLHRRAIARKERALGPDHPSTALGRANLAVLELGRGRPDRAVPLLERALAGYTASLGAKHADTVVCRSLLREARRAARA